MVTHKLVYFLLLSLTLLAACDKSPLNSQVQSSTTEDPTIDISTDLAERFARTDVNPEHREAVIVTLVPGTDLQTLQAAGMQIDNVMKTTSIVTGTVNAITFNKLKSLSGIERIESDGTMKAL